MRSALLTAPLVAAAYAATTTSKDYTLVSEISGSVTVVSTYYYSNPNTKFLTETNSNGVITGQPGTATAVTGMPSAVTTQPTVATIPAGLSSPPVVATIPAGLPTGYDTITYNISKALTSFTISVGKSTTVVLGGAQAGTTSGSVFIPAGQGTHTGGGSKPTGTNGNNNNGGTATGSAAASSSSGAAGNVKVASAGVLGLGALFAALL